MRLLIYIPVVHTEAEMGSLSEALAGMHRERFGEKEWDEHNRTIRGAWDEIERQIGSLGLDLNRVKVYLDAMPLCGQEQRIVRDLAVGGSLNHQIVVRMLDGGATVVGTEDPGLLLEEYRLVKKQLEHLARKGDTADQGDAEQDAMLRERRDRFVARRVEETLGEGETGVLFMGLLHDVPRHLGSGIPVQFLPNHLPFGRDLTTRDGATDHTRGKGDAAHESGA